MKKNNLISIIVPIYNGEEHLLDLFESIDAQIYQNYEVILVDDGSKDLTSSICKKKVSSNSKYQYYYKKNSGVSDSRNYGIQKSRGNFICFVDSDDGISPYYLHHFDYCLNSKDADFVCCDMIKFKDKYANDNEKKEIKYSSIKDDTYEIVFSKYAGYVWNKVYNRKIIIDNDIKFNASIGMCEDMVFNFEYLKHINDFICIDNKNYYYRISSNSESKSMENIKWFTIFNSFDLIFDLKKNYNEKIYNKLCYAYIFNLYQGMYRLRFVKKNSNSMYKTYKKMIKKRINEIPFLNCKLSKKNKLKVFLYKHFNHLSFRYKIAKESNIWKNFQ